MSQVLKDFFKGGVVLTAGAVIAIVVLLLVFILGILLHILGAIASFLFFVALLFLSIWLVGFLYRKIRETYRQ